MEYILAVVLGFIVAKLFLSILYLLDIVRMMIKEKISQHSFRKRWKDIPRVIPDNGNYSQIFRNSVLIHGQD